MPTTILPGETYEMAKARRFYEEAYLDRKLDWVLERTESILKDDDYVMDILSQVHDDHPELFLQILRATYGNAINVLSDLHTVVTKYARTMAESEASVRSFN